MLKVLLNYFLFKITVFRFKERISFFLYTTYALSVHSGLVSGDSGKETWLKGK
jgi:hypothetical protein